MSAAHDKDLVKVFAELAQQRLPDEPASRDKQGFARLQERMAESQAQRGILPWARVGGLALAAVAVLGAGAWWFASARHITYQVENAQVAADGKLFGGTSGGQVHFSDGSQLALAPGSQTTVSELDAHGAHVRVEEGSAHFAIEHKQGAAWAVLAGPYTVRVTGTAFDVGWVAGTQRFEITMQSGSVVITGPLAPSGVVLKAGQRLHADHELKVDDADAPNEAAPPAPTESAVPAVEEVLAPAGSTSRRSARGPSWRSLVANGKFETVLNEAEHRGIGNVLGSANLEDLSALADAARYAQRPNWSQRALLAQRQRFPSTPQARDAAFFLGSLGEGQGGGLAWFDRYLQESPNGAYASQALGRKLMLVYGQHRGQEARQIATEYNARYPKGPYASTARKVLGEPSKGAAPAGKAAVP